VGRRIRILERAWPLLFLLVAACASGGGKTAPPAVVEEPPPDRPVHRLVFIHGWNGLVRDWHEFYLAASERMPAHCEVYIVSGLDRFMGALDSSNDRVVEEIEAFLDGNAIPRENLHLVAHSMGGLAARRFVTLNPGAARQVFLLGTPSGGVRVLGSGDLDRWCTPEGIEVFNEANMPDPSVDWFVVAGNHYRGPLAGAFWEGSPNDGVIATASVLRFAELCGDSIPCQVRVGNLTHPDWNWGENLLRSERVIDWVLGRVEADLNESTTIIEE
jgi:pimeloyl-ACP methyl ester carboxylesterase